jgi:hypothetical protein
VFGPALKGDYRKERCDCERVGTGRGARDFVRFWGDRNLGDPHRGAREGISGREVGFHTLVLQYLWSQVTRHLMDSCDDECTTEVLCYVSVC